MMKTPNDAVESESINSDASPPSSSRVVNEKIQRLFDLVPEIGTRWRWYDIPYRAINWCLRSRLGRHFPAAIRRFLVVGLNIFLTINHYEC